MIRADECVRIGMVTVCDGPEIADTLVNNSQRTSVAIVGVVAQW